MEQKRQSRLYCIFARPNGSTGRYKRMSGHAYKLDIARVLWQDLAIRLALSGKQVVFKTVKY